MWVAYTITTIFFVDISSTTITSIIVAFSSICSISAIAIIHFFRDFTALKNKMYSVIHISTHPSKELCSKMALGEVGLSLP
jgi:hypothetical protein